MGVLEPGREEDLALEPLDGDLAEEIQPEHLDRHLAPKGGFLGEEHVRHAPAIELAFNAIRAYEPGFQPFCKL